MLASNVAERELEYSIACEQIRFSASECQDVCTVTTFRRSSEPCSQYTSILRRTALYPVTCMDDDD